jgi:MarR-like DNA-binding transcriptional regulator SgrR of sgrS sRNA
MYEGAEETPVVGGTISEAIIGNFPHLNPLLPSTGYNAYINSILYRSLLRYDTKEQKIQSDLASCDISNLSLIECYLENNIKWSDGRAITEDDIIATLNLIEKSNINPGISSLLENTTIEK